jgi:hypothetical protein
MGGRGMRGEMVEGWLSWQKMTTGFISPFDLFPKWTRGEIDFEGLMA